MSELIRPLDDEVLEEKRNKLRSLFERLTEDYDKDVDETVEVLLDIYSDGYRQMYSEIFPIISKIHHSDKYGGLDFLTDNLESARKHIKILIQSEPHSVNEGKISEYRELYGKVLKLSDHVNLEVQRLLSSEEVRRSTSKLEDDIQKSQKNLARAQKKIRRMQTEVIVILGIFTAIVMAMSGGLSLMSSSLGGMSSTSPYKIAFVIVLCGILIFNIIAFLMSCINHMVNDLYESEDSNSNNKGHLKQLSRIVSNNTFLIAFNIMLLIMLAIDILCWIGFGNRGI